MLPVRNGPADTQADERADDFRIMRLSEERPDMRGHDRSDVGNLLQLGFGG